MKKNKERHLCPGCEVQNHLESISGCFEVMAATNPKLVTKERLAEAGQLLNQIAALIAEYEQAGRVQ